MPKRYCILLNLSAGFYEKLVRVKLLTYVWYFFLMLLLTVLTQVGGVIFLLSLITCQLIWKKKGSARIRSWPLFGVFSGGYLFVSMVLIPPIASAISDREPLPAFSDAIGPRTMWTALLNRQYVDSEMKDLMIDLGDYMQDQFPDHKVLYLDAGFPFFDGFPLLPHLSHNDGEEVDLAFCYSSSDNGEFVPSSPTWIGYGGCEAPVSGEWNQPAACEQAGHWQYSLLDDLFGAHDSDLVLNQERTTAMVKYLAASPKIGKMFLEPHLKTRWQVGFAKVRYHGCHAVRHDDHLHIQF